MQFLRKGMSSNMVQSMFRLQSLRSLLPYKLQFFFARNIAGRQNASKNQQKPQNISQYSEATNQNESKHETTTQTSADQSESQGSKVSFRKKKQDNSQQQVVATAKSKGHQFQQLSKKQIMENMMQKQGINNNEDVSPSEIRKMTQAEKLEAKEQQNQMNRVYNQYLEHIDSDKYDKQLEDLISSKLAEGKDENQIIQEILRGEDQVKQKPPTNLAKDKNDQNTLGNGEGEGQSDPLIFMPEGELKNSIIAQAEQLKKFNEILSAHNKQDGSSNAKKLSELPFSEQENPNRKLTKQEKSDVELRLLAIEDYISTPGNKPKKDYSQMDLKIKVMEEGDKSRLTMEQKKQALKEIQKKTQDMQLNVKGKTDLLNQKIKQKQLQVDTKLQTLPENEQEDSEFKALAEGDRDKAIERIEEGSKQDKRVTQKLKQLVEPDSFQRQKNQILRVMGKLGVPAELAVRDQGMMELFTSISKESLIAEKKLEEEKAEQKKRQEEKERLKRFKKYAEELNNLELKQDVDYLKKKKLADENESVLSSKIRKDPEFGLIPDIEQIDRINQLERENMVGDTWWELHSQRSLRRLEDFIHDYFQRDKASLNAILKDEILLVDEVVPNEAMTVINIFWKIIPRAVMQNIAESVNEESHSLNPINKKKKSQQQVATENEEERQTQTNSKAKKQMGETGTNYFQKKTKEEMQAEQRQKKLEKVLQNLRKHSKYLSGKICKEMGFKYGPEIRFYISRHLERISDAEKELQRTIPEMVQMEVKERIKQGEQIDVKTLEMLHNKYYYKVQDQTMDILSNKNQFHQIMSQEKKDEKLKSEGILQGRNGKYKYDDQGKWIRNNRDESGQKKKYVKKDKAKKFWDELKG